MSVSSATNLDALTLADIQDYADFIIETFKVPEERRENVVMEVLCMRDTVIEKSGWFDVLPGLKARGF